MLSVILARKLLGMLGPQMIRKECIEVLRKEMRVVSKRAGVVPHLSPLDAIVEATGVPGCGGPKLF